MVNYSAILVASIIGYLIPMLWYSPILFGKQWLKLTKMKNMKMSTGVFIVGFVSTLVFNYVLAVIVEYSRSNTFIDGAGIGLLAWFGFIATVSLGGVLYEKMPLSLYWINTIQYLISIVIAGGILSVWQ